MKQQKKAAKRRKGVKLGRPKVTFDTFAQASSSMGIPLEVLKAAKRAGCPMFKGSRVVSVGLREWIAAHAEAVKQAAAGDSLKDQKTREEIRRLKNGNDADEGLLIKRSVVCENHAAILGRLLPRLETILTSEYPQMVVGLDLVQVRIKGRQVFDSILASFREAGDLWAGV